MKKFASLLLALSLTLCLAGCGGATAPQNDAQESVAQEETTPDAEPSGEDTAEEETALTTVSPGKLTMSTNAAFPPYEMTTDDGGYTASCEVTVEAEPEPDPEPEPEG